MICGLLTITFFRNCSVCVCVCGCGCGVCVGVGVGVGVCVQVDIFRTDVHCARLPEPADAGEQRDVTGSHQHQPVHQDLPSASLPGCLHQSQHLPHDSR